jgi:membrane fusion protein, heavy metal efflux system
LKESFTLKKYEVITAFYFKSNFKTMNKLLLPLAVIIIMLLSCSHEHAHVQEAEGKGLEALAYTLYTDRTELFVEFKPLVVGTECRFAAHFTALGETFKAFTEGTITLTVDVNGKQVAVTATEPQVPGIFRLRLTPNTAGIAKLSFNIKTKSFTDLITIDSVKVYSDEKSALADQHEESGGAGNITYLKEQAWKVDFANAPVKKTMFSDIIKTNGQILSAPGDEVIITAKAKGIVLFSGKKTIVGSAVNAGTNLFTITGGDLTEGNIDATYKEARSNYEKAKTDYERSKELVKDKIVSEKDFQQSKVDFENAQIVFNTVARNYSDGGQTVSSTMTGFLKNILVSEGQYVNAGTPLATISKNKKLILQANVSQKYFDKLKGITTANFRTAGNNTVYDAEQLNGKLLSYGKSTSANSPFIPITFEIDNTGNFIPGSVAEVYLKSFPVADALVIPVSSLIEEQGNFFVFVQMEGESFQKREVKLGAADGINVQLLSGVSEGERVVTKGAYQIKLSMASGTLPAHGHEH